MIDKDLIYEKLAMIENTIAELSEIFETLPPEDDEGLFLKWLIYELNNLEHQNDKTIQYFSNYIKFLEESDNDETL